MFVFLVDLSFEPGEYMPEQAHEIGRLLADKITIKLKYMACKKERR